MKDLVNIILKIYHEGDLSYVLNKYIDVNYWDKKLGLYFPV